jgi:hypothetical protein
MRAIYDDFKFVSTQQLGYSAWDDVYNVATNITQEDVDQFVADNYNDHFLEAGKLTLYVFQFCHTHTAQYIAIHYRWNVVLKLYIQRHTNTKLTPQIR